MPWPTPLSLPHPDFTAGTPIKHEEILDNERAIRDWAEAAMDETTGHGHTGTVNDGKPIPKAGITLGALVRSATLVVAATDSSAVGKAVADYVCDGISDQTEINTAVTTLGATGGRVVLLEGTFTIDGAINLTAGTFLEGQGPKTVIKLKDAHNLDINMLNIAAADVWVKGLAIDGNKAMQTAGTQRAVFATGGQYARLEGLLVSNARSHGIYLNACADSVVANCRISSSGSVGMTVDGGSHRTSILCNLVRQSDAAGISLAGNDYLRVIWNHSRSNKEYGLGLWIVNHCLVANNIVSENGQAADNTYDNIVVWGDSNYNMIQGNICRHGGGAIQTRYGLNIQEAACDLNMVTNNDLALAGRTGNFNNLGTGTVTAAGNRI